MNRKFLTTPRLPFRLNSDRLLWGIIITVIIVLFLPWVSFSTGVGHVTAIDPNERVQSITAPVTGFVRQWFVKEGQAVKKGELIAELSDNDPDLLERFQREKKAAEAALNSARLMMNTAEINLKRQKSLYEQGLSARKDFEYARIEFSKHEMEVAKALVTLTKAETQLSRQSSQEVRAPRNGTVVRILPGERGQLIKAGSAILVFSPEVARPAVEMWVDGNDASMVVPGQPARIQFEGWPSLQIAGWPSLAINTFPARVFLVDQASSYKGKVRVLLIPDGQWPGQKILRLGIHTKGYIQLADSFILREIWRLLNNFPAFAEPIQDELHKLMTKKTVTDYESETISK